MNQETNFEGKFIGIMFTIDFWKVSLSCRSYKSRIDESSMYCVWHPDQRFVDGCVVKAHVWRVLQHVMEISKRIRVPLINQNQLPVSHIVCHSVCHRRKWLQVILEEIQFPLRQTYTIVMSSINNPSKNYPKQYMPTVGGDTIKPR